jgi:ABC-2 type transport system ATP-binding protein
VQSSNEQVGRFRDGRTDHPPALSARGITKRFGRKVVLDGVDLDVWPGEAVALVGENGAGKTTLLRICAGLLAADAGEIRVSGAVGYCPQDAGLLDLLTADEHLLLFGRAKRQSREGALAAGRGTLETFGFPLGEQAVSQDLSGGTRQKLNLALALLGNPELVLLDEPYQGFDRGTYVNFWDHVDAWRSRGMAILIVTHMLAELTRVDRILELPVRGNTQQQVARQTGRP